MAYIRGAVYLVRTSMAPPMWECYGNSRNNLHGETISFTSIVLVHEHLLDHELEAQEQLSKIKRALKRSLAEME